LRPCSKASYTPDGVRALLKDFAGEKVLDLLYLKNVERIEVWVAQHSEYNILI